MSGRSHMSGRAMEALLALSALAALAASASAAGELVVLRSPDSIEFAGREPLPGGLLKEVYSAALGFSTAHGAEWPGLAVSDPFGLPEAVVELRADGVVSLGAGALEGRRYPLLTERGERAAAEALRRRVEQRFPEGGNRLVDADLGEGVDAFGPLRERDGDGDGGPTFEALKPAVDDEDRQFARELRLLEAVAEKVAGGAVAPDGKVDYYFFSFPSLHALSDLHGENSPAVSEAKALLGDAASKLADAFYRAYDGNVLVTLVTSDSAHTRRARSLLDDSSASKIHLLNIATTYSADYPVIFNIIFWFSVVLILALIAISYTIGDMDPGRDSIIYRMTSNRMKKEN